jgi:hypothetical protein
VAISLKRWQQLETATPPNSLLLNTAGMLVAVVDHLRDALTGRAAKNPPNPQIH